MKFAAVPLFCAVLLANAIPAANATRSAPSAWEWLDGTRSMLLASPVPRDRALGAMMIFPQNAADAALSNATLVDAVQATPTDPLVHWLAAIRAPSDANLAALAQLEADNGAVWLLVLTHAQGDDRGTELALARLASSSRYDEHFADTVHALIDVFTRFPPDFPESADGDEPIVVGAIGLAASAMPAGVALSKVCAADVAPPDTTRERQCVAAGRLQLHQGKTLVARTLGRAVLARFPDRMTEDDRSAGRDLDWYTDAAREFSATIAVGNDWRQLDNEIQIIQRALARAGRPITAPTERVVPPPPSIE